VATFRDEHARTGRSRTRWLIGLGALIAIAAVVVLLVVYAGGGSGGGVGY
jgi:hypothetical protein